MVKLKQILKEIFNPREAEEERERNGLKGRIEFATNPANFKTPPFRYRGMNYSEFASQSTRREVIYFRGGYVLLAQKEYENPSQKEVIIAGLVNGPHPEEEYDEDITGGKKYLAMKLSREGLEEQVLRNGDDLNLLAEIAIRKGFQGEFRYCGYIGSAIFDRIIPGRIKFV